jgi:hypothetical protein
MRTAHQLRQKGDLSLEREKPNTCTTMRTSRRRNWRGSWHLMQSTIRRWILLNSKFAKYLRNFVNRWVTLFIVALHTLLLSHSGSPIVSFVFAYKILCLLNVGLNGLLISVTRFAEFLPIRTEESTPGANPMTSLQIQCHRCIH